MSSNSPFPVFHFLGDESREGPRRDGPGEEQGVTWGVQGEEWAGRCGFQGEGEGIQGGSASEFLALWPFEL